MKSKKHSKSKQVTIVEGVLRSTISGDVPSSKLIRHCSFRPEGSFFAAQAGSWDGITRLASKRVDGSISFPSGLTNSIVTFLTDLGIRIKHARDYNPKLVKSRDIVPLNTKILRPYQKEALLACFEQRRGILKLPTAAGKTAVAAALIRAVKRRSITYTHKKDMLYQIANTYKEEIGDFVGILGDGKHQLDPPITVASIQTVHRNIKKYQRFLASKQVLIGDEVHHASSNSWYKVLQQTPAHYRIGLTATPLIDSRKILLEATTGPIIYTKSAQELIEEGYISEPIVVMIPITKPVLPERYDYHKAYDEGIMGSGYRNRTIVRLCRYIKENHRYLLPIVIMVRRLEHIDNLEAGFDGLNARFLDGSDKSEKRRKVFEEIDNRSIDVAVVSTIFDEGIDVSNIRTLIKASAGKSAVGTVQNLGRGMRLAEGKDQVLFIDLFDMTHEYLERHARKRRAIYRREGYKVNMLSLSETYGLIEEEL